MLCERIIFSKRNPSRSNQISNYLVSDHCSSLIDAREEVLAKVDYAQDEITPFLDTRQKIARYIEFLNTKTYLAIICITVIGSILFLMLVAVAKFLVFTKHLLFGDNLLLFIASGLGAALFATWLCGRFAVTAEGSGIAEMKSILTGIVFQDFFSIKTMVVKYFSCIAVKVSGLGMGYEGAFIHIIGAFAFNVTKLPFFREIDTEHNRKSITLAGISAAMVLAFGTPIGAMLFALDMCPANFQLPNMFKCFIAGAVAYFIWCIMYNVFSVSAVTKMEAARYELGELIWFVFLGLIEGTLCTLYLFAFSKYLVFKRASQLPIFANRYYYIGLVSVVISLVTFWHPNFVFGVKEVISDLTNLKDLHESNRKIQWWYNDDRVLSELFYCLVGRLVMFWGFSSSAIPFGVFGPGLSTGVILARLYGEFVTRVFALKTTANVFAACGFAAFLCGFTRSFAPMVCILEMTGEMSLILPTLVSSMIGFLFSSIFNIGFFEMIISIRKLPYLPTFMPPDRGAIPIGEIYEPLGRDFIHDDANLYDMFDLLIGKTELNSKEFFPIVHRETKRIKAYVRAEDCVQYMRASVVNVEAILIEHKPNLSHQIYRNLSTFVHDHGTDAEKIISKRIWQQLRKIKVQTDRFVIGQFGTAVAKNRVESHQELNLLETPSQEVRFTERASTTFELDSRMKEKARQEEKDMSKKIIMELLSRVSVDFESPVLRVNPVPILVSTKVTATKIHFIFLMLGIPVVWVQNCDGQLLGKITLDSFLKFKSA